MVERKLTETQWRNIADLRAHWNAFCDCDHTDPDFIDRMRDAGFVRLRAVKRSDLEESFAAERGIELGGHVWELTAKGSRELAVSK